MRTFLGIVLALTPVTFWVAWEPEILLAAMAIALASAGLLVLLEESSPQQAVDGGRAELPPRFIEEVHQLFPLTYHHSLSGRARFRQVMRKLAQGGSHARSTGN